MISLKAILLPTDFSDYSAYATKYACAFSEQFDAELHILHVFQEAVPTTPMTGLAFPPPESYLTEIREHAAKSLAELLDREWETGRRIVRATAKGVPFVEIIRYAKQGDVDMIVMGTHGRTGLAHMLMGSVAEKVVRKAPCPVLTVHPTDHQFVMP